jgi:hypothetical protein
LPPSRLPSRSRCRTSPDIGTIYVTVT